MADAELGNLKAYVPRFAFHLIEERSFFEDRLEEARDLISALFTLEGAGELSLEERAAKVQGWLGAFADRHPELVARFMNWVRARFGEDNRKGGEARAENVQAPGNLSRASPPPPVTRWPPPPVTRWPPHLSRAGPPHLSRASPLHLSRTR